MLPRLLAALNSLRRVRLLQPWQPLLVAALLLASLAVSSLAAVALAVALSSAWPLLVSFGRRLRRGAAARPYAPALEGLLMLAFFAALTWGVLGFVITKHIPVDRGDHHIMIARADLLTRGLRDGFVAHWSHLFQGGDTLTDLYPVFLNWVTALIHLASPSGTAFVDSYSRLCIVAWGFRGFCAYVLARRFAGPVPALLVSVASLFDVGAEVFDGTWHGVFYWGMIHNNLALSLGLLALAFQLDLTRVVSSAGILRCVSLVALASVAHPLGMLFCTVSVAALGGAALLRAQRFRRLAWALAASLLGLLLAAVWTVPYVRALSAHGFNGSLPGVDYGDLGRGLLNGSVPVSSFGAWVGLAFVGLLCALGSRKVPRLAVGLLALAFLLLALSPFLVQSRVLEVFKSFLDAQQRRCLTVLKVALIPSLAWLVQALWQQLARREPGAGPRALLGRALLIGLVVLGPGRAVARGFDAVGKDLRDQLPEPSASKYGKRENDTDDRHREAFDWIKARRKADPSPTPWRMTYWNRFDQRMHAHWTWVQGLETGVPLVDFGWVSANFIRNRPREMTPQGMQDWNIRYAMGLSSTPDVPGFTLRHRVGAYHIYEYEAYDDRFVLANAPVVISGLKVTEQTIEFDVAGAPGAGADVKVRCAWFPRWRGTQAGRELEVTPVPPHVGALAGQDQLGVRVSNGHVVLRADRTMPGFGLGLATACFGLLATALVLRRSVRAKLEHWVRRARAIVLARGARAVQALRARAFRWLLIATGLGLALAFLLPGTRLLSHPVLEGVGLSVTGVDATGKPLDCWASPLHGRYFCGTSTTVEAALGVTPPLDHSGEYGKFWPGTRVRLKEPRSSLTLSFNRVDARSGKLKLLSTTSGSVDLVVRTPRGETKPVRLAGNQVQVIQLPAGLSRWGSLDLLVSSPGGAAEAILRGELLP